MDIILSQDKLNGTNKRGITIFNWRGQFNSNFVAYILKKFAHDNSVVCDPFSGSGTVLYECAKRNISCVGMDINPSAYYMSKFFSYANICQSDRENLIECIKKNIEYILSADKVTFEDFVKEIKGVSSEKEICFVINVAFIASKSKNLDINLDKKIWKAFKYIENQMVNLPVTDNLIGVYLKDVRELSENELNSKFDLIFTSPPYINVFNYHQNYRKAVELLGWNVLDIAQSEIGSNRKNRGNRFKTVVQYCSDMLFALKGVWNSLKKDGVAILVLGKISSVIGMEFYNGAIIKDLIEEMKCFNMKECHERSFINKFGKEIYEDVIIFEKGSDILCDTDIARRVAAKHLKHAMNNSEITDEISEKIEQTLKEIQIIESSPILNIKRMAI